MALLREQGAAVDDIALYDTITAVPDPPVLEELRRGVDVLTFTSPSSVRNFLRILSDAGLDAGAIMDAALIVAIGPVTAAELAQHGRTADIVPTEYTVEAMIAALTQHVVAERQRGQT